MFFLGYDLLGLLFLILASPYSPLYALIFLKRKTGARMPL